MKLNQFIDAHNHLYDGFTLDEMKSVYDSYQINLGIVSDLTGGSQTNSLGLRTPEQTIQANQSVYQAVQNTSFLKGQFFFDCRYDVASQELFDYLLENRDTFIGIKIHNPISQTAANKPVWDGILGFAQENHIPVMFHTDYTDLCGITQMQDVIDRFPELIVILGHSFLDVPAQDVIAFMKKNPKVIGEISWAKEEKVMELIQAIPSERLMFGTDAPVDGELGRGIPLDPERANFKWYCPLLERLKELPDEDYNNLMRYTGEKVYGLSEKCR